MNVLLWDQPVTGLLCYRERASFLTELKLIRPQCNNKRLVRYTSQWVTKHQGRGGTQGLQKLQQKQQNSIRKGGGRKHSQKRWEAPKVEEETSSHWFLLISVHLQYERGVVYILEHERNPNHLRGVTFPFATSKHKRNHVHSNVQLKTNIDNRHK